MPGYLYYKVQVALLTNTEISAKYSNILYIFSSDSAVELPEYTKIYHHLIDLLEDKQPPYGLIYNLELVELEMLKTYIKANLASSLI